MEIITVKVSFLARDREREFFLVQLFITIILVYVRNIHGDGTVRSQSRAKNETFTVIKIKKISKFFSPKR